METKKKYLKQSIGQIIGYVFTFFIFTTILYFILLLSGKLPKFGGYFSVILITVIIIFIGRAIKFWLSNF